jgi:hypothetical protein
MQSLTVTSLERNPNQHTADEVYLALVGRTGSRKFTFRYELLSAANAKLADLTSVVSASVSQNWFADIKRTAKFVIKDGVDQIDWLSNRIKPYIQLHLAPYGENDWVEWPQGVFLLSTPTRSTDSAGTVTRQVTAYDALQVSADDKVTTRYTVNSATSYTSAVNTLLGGVSANVAPTTKTLPVAKEWEPGTSKLKIINELLTAINYNSLSFDEDGLAVVAPYVLPSERPSGWSYTDNQDSVLLPEVDQTLDLYDVPNKWTLVVSDPDRSALTSTYTNSDPTSPTSTVNRARTIVDFRTEQDAADQGALDARVARLAYEASQVYEAIEFESGMMPIHSGNDVYDIGFTALGINSKYSESEWSMNLSAGARMKHRARRQVTV